MQRSITPVSARTFFLVTILISLLVWSPALLNHFKLATPPPLVAGLSQLFGILMPAVIASILTARAGGKAALRQLFGRLTTWRVGWQWWAAAALLHPALLLLIAIPFNLLGNLSTVTPGYLIVQLIMLTLTVLGEEIGWRGVGLPALQKQHSALRSSLIIGALTAIWHIPFWLIIGNLEQFGVGYMLMNCLYVFLPSIFLSWIFNHTRASLLMPVVFHFCFNIVNVALLQTTNNIGAYSMLLICDGVLALLLVSRLEPDADQAMYRAQAAS